MQRARAPTTVVVIADGIEHEVGEIAAGALDLGLVDVLMRLALTARRRGWTVRVRDASDELRGLLDLVGLLDVVAFEPGREPEVGEQLGVHEVMEPRDRAV